MAKGAVFFHSRFPFHDGQIGQKYFVVLNDPQNDEPYLIVKTTTNLRNKAFQSGCNPSQQVFFLPQHSCLFPEATLVQLVDIYEFSAEEFLKASLAQQIVHSVGDLDAIHVAQIINCVRKLKEDISEKHFALITR
jgi:hypothetical protein